MKKAISMFLALTLAASTSASFASAAQAVTTSVRQVQLAAVMPVDVKTGANYTELVNTAKTYKQNEIITVAAIAEMKNIAMDINISSAAGQRMDMRLSSPTIDLSYGMASSFFAYSAKGSGKWSKIAAGTGQGVVSQNAGAVTLKAYAVDNDNVGYFINGVQTSKTGMAINQSDDYAPFIGKTGKTDSGDPCVWIPAINSSSAPENVQYALVLSGLVKNVAAGSMKAEMLVSSREEFKAMGGGLDLCWSSARNLYNGSNTAEAKVLSVGTEYTIIRLYEKMNGSANREDVTNWLLAKGYRFATDREKLKYNGEAGTLEVFQIYRCDSSAANKAGQFVANLITEATKNPAQSAKCLWLADCDYKRLSFNENKYYYVDGPADVTE